MSMIWIFKFSGPDFWLHSTDEFFMYLKNRELIFFKKKYWVTMIKLTFNIILDKVSLVQMSDTLSLSLVSCLQSALKLALGNWFEGCQVDKCWDNKASTTTKIFCSTSSEWFFKCKKAWNNKKFKVKDT